MLVACVLHASWWRRLRPDSKVRATYCVSLGRDSLFRDVVFGFSMLLSVFFGGGPSGFCMRENVLSQGLQRTQC